MIETVPDRIEYNLRRKIDILEKIYESDKRIVEKLADPGFGFEIYDEYLEEQDEYENTLTELDREYDDILSGANAGALKNISATVREKILKLVNEMNGKAEAVSALEKQTRAAVESYMNKRKNEINISRRNVRNIQSSYRPQNYSQTSEISIFDTSN